MNCKKIVCVNEKPEGHNKMFFGEYGNYVRVDKLLFPQIKALYEASESNVWFMNEIDYTKDIIGCQELPDNVLSKFQKNIVYQNLMDSGVSNIFNEIAKVASVSELQYLYGRIGTEEKIHAMTYSNGLSIVFGATAEEILDTVYTDGIIKTVNSRIEEYSTKKLLNLIAQHRENDVSSILKELKQYGIHSVLSEPQNLSINTINKYLELKSRGLI